jgi:hypothetical protein
MPTVNCYNNRPFLCRGERIAKQLKIREAAYARLAGLGYIFIAIQAK